ncbi:hypothetical protein MAPG_10497 [Magnaporthiopsis poae ATCC 64411]|uniref:Uncharacterized protein n=1 Tax=Magnaporthiopsis poae (strain ATCC 64411 / 73-15) TaxID=644358 RepID=A0A0C4ECR4_MAGP6|nr:hypothetical protein MAPG_10497 [Magnaporthiopsis poae ATCC 64411]
MLYARRRSVATSSDRHRSPSPFAPTPSSSGPGASVLQRPSSRQSIGGSAQKPSQIQGPHVAAHRQSFAENLRNPPSSPRSHRHFSFTQFALQKLLSHPPSSRVPNPQFAGRDWRDVAVGELVSQNDIKWVDLDTSVKEATMTLLKSGPTNKKQPAGQLISAKASALLGRRHIRKCIGVKDISIGRDVARLLFTRQLSFDVCGHHRSGHGLLIGSMRTFGPLINTNLIFIMGSIPWRCPAGWLR